MPGYDDIQECGTGCIDAEGDAEAGRPAMLIRGMLFRNELAGSPMPRGLTIAERLAEVMIEKALAGSPEHMQMILDRADPVGGTP